MMVAFRDFSDRGLLGSEKSQPQWRDTTNMYIVMISAQDGMDQFKASVKGPNIISVKTNIHPEIDISKTRRSGCNVTVFNFPMKDHRHYLRYTGTLPEMNSLTVCVWVKPGNKVEFVKGAIMSYCTKDAIDCNTLLVWLRGKNATVFVNSHEYGFYQVPSITIRSHLCIVTDMNILKYYINGFEHGSSTIVSEKENKPGGGVLILGQDQDGNINGSSPGVLLQGHQGFHGEIQGLRLWKRAMNQEEIRDLHLSRCHCANDSIITFNESNSIIGGDVTATYNVSCDENE